MLWACFERDSTIPANRMRRRGAGLRLSIRGSSSLDIPMLATLLPLILAPAVQQDLFVQPVNQLSRPGRVTQHAAYTDAFSSGWELDSQGRKRAMRYFNPGSQGGQALDLGAFVPGGESAALGTSVGGQIVGWAEDVVQGVQVRRPFLFDDQNGLQLIPLPQASEGWAIGIATFGHSAAGTMRRADGLLQAWTAEIWPAVSTALPLSTPANWESEALVMSQSNGVAPLLVGGLLRDPSGREFAATWGRSGQTVVPTPGIGNARVTGLTEYDMVCGTFVDAAGIEQGFVCDLSDPVNSLIVLPSLGGSWTRPTGMDNQFIWGASGDSQGQSRAFQYALDSQVMEDLNDRANTSSGMTLTHVTSAAFGHLYSFDLEVNGVQYGAFSSTVVMSAWPLDAGAPTTLSMFAGPRNSPAAFVYGFNPGQTAVPGSSGLILDIDQARLVATGRTDSSGALQQTVQVPPQAAGITVLLQAVVPDYSITTSVKIVTFK